MPTMVRETWTDERLDEFSKRIDQRFDEVDRRLDEMDRRFEQLNGRFDRLTFILIVGLLGLILSPQI
jgi:tetrahydromethanopterin S-methyltransferase subunit G